MQPIPGDLLKSTLSSSSSASANEPLQKVLSFQITLELALMWKHQSSGLCCISPLPNFVFHYRLTENIRALNLMMHPEAVCTYFHVSLSVVIEGK